MQKSLYVPSMIGSFLQVALVDDDVVRETVIPIFFDMMQCEFNSSPSRTFSKVSFSSPSFFFHDVSKVLLLTKNGLAFLTYFSGLTRS